MSEPFIGEIKIVGFNFAPRGWALCEGQLLPISSNTALFSLLGTTFGGDGRVTFGLPALRGRVPVGVGSGPGLNPVSWGQKSGNNNTTLITANLPSHNHTVQVGVANGGASTTQATNNAIANQGTTNYGAPQASYSRALGGVSCGNTGSSQSFSNMQPFLGLYMVIALLGLYPSRS